MNKTKIEYVNYTINPIKGVCLRDCKLPNGTSYCYARRMYKRFKWNEEVRLDMSILNLDKIKEPSRIFICSTHDLFGEWIPDKWIFDIITKCQNYPQHTFLLLTKNPKRYIDFTFRNNFWLGQTVVEAKDYVEIKNKNITFVSFEPLLNKLGEFYFPADWFIIGGLTPKPIHKKGWIDSILSQANYFGVPVFIKSNAKYPTIKQEFPIPKVTAGL